MKTVADDFAARLMRWQRRHGRHDLPWQNTRDAYRIWVSEIMLQQTQVAAVIPYFKRFIERFPDVKALALARADEVLKFWSGLGYYSRARNLHRAAGIIAATRGGVFPGSADAIRELPGIGRSTAGAIAALAFGIKQPILDGNVKRVLARQFGIPGYPGKPRVEKKLWSLAESLLPRRGIECYTQALMDLGATVCTRTRPACVKCPVRRSCVAYREARVAEFPRPKPRKALPRKKTTMLVLLRAGSVLLQKRPPAGVWGGLWSLPEVAPGARALARALEEFGLQAKRGARLPQLKHGFSHFRLDIRPQVLYVTGARIEAREKACLWIGVKDAIGAAIPAPVRKILKSLDAGNAA